MYFNQQQSSANNPNLNSNVQQNSTSQQQNSGQTSQNSSQQQNSVNQPQSGPNNLGNQSGAQNQNVQQPGNHLGNQLSNSQNASQQHTQGAYGNISTNDMHATGMSANGAGIPGMLGASGMGGSGGMPVVSGHGVGMPVSQHQASMGGDMYSMSQTQTINFTQQSLRQRVNGSSGKWNFLLYLFNQVIIILF